jgi:hypothetical protein
MVSFSYNLHSVIRGLWEIVTEWYNIINNEKDCNILARFTMDKRTSKFTFTLLKVGNRA